MTRSEIIQTAINQYVGQVEFLSEDANLMIGTGFETNFRCQAEYSKTILEILTAELDREKNEPMTIEEILDMNGKPVWCQTGDGYEGWALVIVDKYQDGGHYLYLFSDDLTRDGINECFEPDEDFINLKFSDDPDGHFGLHVLGWRAYRYEPKGDPNV